MNGERIIIDTLEEFRDAILPNKIVTITFDSSVAFRNFFGIDPKNSIELTLDFSTIEIDDFKQEPKINNSFYRGIGVENTWVMGVFNTISDSLKSNKKKRNWLHAQNTYGYSILLLGIPLVFWILSYLDGSISGRFGISNSILYVFINIYFGYLLLILIRFSFNITKKLYPYLEFNYSKKENYQKFRGFIWVIIVSVMGKLIYDICYFIVKRFF